MALCGRIHLFLQHPLVRRADRVLRAAEHLCPDLLRMTEGELGHRTADPSLDPLGAERDLVVAFALSPFLRAVRVAHRHAHDRDRGMYATEWDHAGNPAAGPDDDTSADFLAQYPVRGADVVAPLRCDRCRFQ